MGWGCRFGEPRWKIDPMRKNSSLCENFCLKYEISLEKAGMYRRSGLARIETKAHLAFHKAPLFAIGSLSFFVSIYVGFISREMFGLAGAYGSGVLDSKALLLCSWAFLFAFCLFFNRNRKTIRNCLFRSICDLVAILAGVFLYIGGFCVGLKRVYTAEKHKNIYDAFCIEESIVISCVILSYLRYSNTRSLSTAAWASFTVYLLYLCSSRTLFY